MPSDDRDELLRILKDKGYKRFPELIQLASGGHTYDFIDGKEALAEWDDLRLAGQVAVDAVRAAGIEFDAVGGLELGACAFAISVAAAANCRWFFVRKQSKDRGTKRLVEGAQIGPTHRVLLVEDVVTSGGSLLVALDTLRAHVAAQGGEANVVGAVTLVDRGEQARPKFEAAGIPYFPLVTYTSLGIDPVGPV